MKVKVQVFFVPWEIKEEIRSSGGQLSKVIGSGGGPFFLDWPSELYLELKNYNKKESFCFAPRFFLESSEFDQVHWFAMEPDSFCPTVDKDEKWRRAYWNTLPYIPGTKNVRHFPDYRIAKLRHQPKKIVSPGGSFYFVPEEIISIFEKNGFTGMSWGDIRDHKTDSKYETHRLLIPDSVIGPSVLNPSSEWKLGGEGKYAEEYAGRDYLITYAGIRTFSANAFKDAKDFNLTIEPMSGYNVGSVIVSKRVKETIEKEKIKGVFFLPVIEVESALYKTFLELWDAFSKEVKAANPENRIG